MTNTPEKQTEAELRAELRHFTGTETWFRHTMFRDFTYTEGVQFLAERAGAYWLIDWILGAQYGENNVRAEEFQVWDIAVHDDNSATITCTDGNEEAVLEKKIEFTDFPLKTFRLFLTGNVLLLPSEY